jgi:branched-subunit amino acid ABC-type transport system permease component
VNADLLVIGLVTGTTYALLGIGLALIYRLNKILNLAHGEIGAFGAAVVAVLAVRYDWPFVPALVVGIAGGAALGGLTELVVIKRLGDRSAVVVMVATLGAGQLAALLRVSLPDVELFAPYPTLTDASLTIGSVELSGAEIGALVLAPTVALAIWWLLARTTAGAVVRATSANPEATRLAGVNASAVSTAVWVGAGALAVIAAAAAIPLRSGTAVAITTVGPGLLLRGFAAAAFGRFRSVPGTLVGGLVVGVSEALAIQPCSPSRRSSRSRTSSPPRATRSSSPGWPCSWSSSPRPRCSPAGRGRCRSPSSPSPASERSCRPG